MVLYDPDLSTEAEAQHTKIVEEARRLAQLSQLSGNSLFHDQKNCTDVQQALKNQRPLPKIDMFRQKKEHEALQLSHKSYLH